MPTAAQLARAAAQREGTMDKVVTIHRLHKTPDGAGRYTESWQPHQVRAGRLNGLGRAQGQEEQIAGALQGRAGYMWTLPLDDGAGTATDVTRQDRLVSGDRVFEILMVLDRSHLTAYRCVCVDVGDVAQTTF
jgi:head-tail adaptor